MILQTMNEECTLPEKIYCHQLQRKNTGGERAVVDEPQNLGRKVASLFLKMKIVFFFFFTPHHRTSEAGKARVNFVFVTL